MWGNVNWLGACAIPGPRNDDVCLSLTGNDVA